MKTRNQPWWLALTLAAAMVLPWSLRAQDENTNSNSPAESEPGSMAEQGTSPDSAEEPEPSSDEAADRDKEGDGLHHEVIFIVGRDVELKPEETANVVVVIGGNAKIRGKVHEAAVAIWGDLDVQGEVGEAAVAVLGNLQAGPGAKIRGSAVAVGGKLNVLEGASIRGQTQVVDFPEWIKSWFQHCVVLMRPLSFQVGWVWWVASGFFLIYLAVAALFPRPVEACVDELAQRPATTLLMGFLTLLMLPLVSILLTAIFGLGIIIMPFAVAALFLGGIVGKVALLEWLGMRIGHQLGVKPLQRPLIGLLVGTVLVCLLYLIPFMGLMAFCVLSLWAMGIAVTAAFLGLKRELPERPKTPPAAYVPASAPAMQSSFAQAGTAIPSTGSDPAQPLSVNEPQTQASAAPFPVTMPPVMPETLSYPRATFWQRLGAAFLDFVLIALVSAMVGSPRWMMVIALAYFAGLWTWKGTTIGGIVLGLKVVRESGQPITFPVALVRALAGAFSAVVLFLGFLWIAWDPEKQGWHDKVAGTVVLKLPKGTPLICL
jgi:uncharacterized RDD family membrane protein YckC